MRGDSSTKVLYNMILSLYSGEEPGLLSMWRSKIKFRNDVWQIANELMAHIENTHSKCTMGCTLITVHLRMGDYSGFIARHKVSLFPEKYHCLSVKNITNSRSEKNRDHYVANNIPFSYLAMAEHIFIPSKNIKIHQPIRRELFF